MARILITGAAGAVGSALRPRLRHDGHTLVLVDVVQPSTRPGVGEEFHLMSMSDEEAFMHVLERVDAIVHLGGYASERPWNDIAETNIDGSRSVLDAAVRSGVPRILLASSIHAVGFTLFVRAASSSELPPRPDSYYGVGKVALEALGRVYADRFPILVVAARIANYSERPTDVRGLSLWLSPADLHRLVVATLTTSAVGFHLVWGVSANTRNPLDVSAARDIGFEAEDDAEQFADGLRPHAGEPLPELSGVLGGAFAEPEATLGVSRR